MRRSRPEERPDRFPPPTKTISRHGWRRGLTPDEVKGRNTWIVWTRRQRPVLGRADETHVRRVRSAEDRFVAPGLKFSRDNRWNYLGLVNEPCFDKPTGPDPERFGLWLDERDAELPARSVRERSKISGREDRRARQERAGRLLLRLATGIVGLRLFPNPDFDEAAAKKWDPERYYDDPSYYQRQGSGAAVSRRHVLRLLPCRARARSTRRPIPRIRKWANLSSTVGAQYFWVDRIFVWNADPSKLPLSSSSTPRARARSTPRWSRPTTSTIRAP